MKPKKYEYVWRAKWTCDGCKDLECMRGRLILAVGHLQEMEDAGITVRGAVEDDYGFLETDDPKVAARFGFALTLMEDE